MRGWYTQKPPLGAQLDRGHPLARDLCGLWLFNEKSQPMCYDLSGCGNHAPYVNQISSAPRPILRDGPGLNFDGAAGGGALPIGDYVNIGTVRGAPTTQATLAFRLKTATVHGDDAYCRAGLCRFTSQSQNFHYPWYADGKAYCNVFRTTRLSFALSALVNRYAWHWVVITQHPGAWVFYQDMIPVYSTSGQATIALDSDTLIGASHAGSAYEWWGGDMAAAYLWARALTVRDIAELQMRPYAMFAAPKLWMPQAATVGGFYAPYDYGYNARYAPYDYGYDG